MGIILISLPKPMSLAKRNIRKQLISAKHGARNLFGDFRKFRDSGYTNRNLTRIPKLIPKPETDIETQNQFRLSRNQSRYPETNPDIPKPIPIPETLFHQ